MRRISLALALIGAVAAAGCKGGAGTDPSSSGSRKGVAGQTFSVTVKVESGGTVASGVLVGGVFTADGKIACGSGGSACTANWAWSEDVAVVLQATPDAGNFVEFWAGDCTGDAATCTLQGNADKYVIVGFANAETTERPHPDWAPVGATSTLHVAAYRSFAKQCNTCHGLDWTGASRAGSCYACHDLDKLTVADPETGTTQGLHFDKNGWSGHNSAGCARCHADGGFRDWIGLQGSSSLGFIADPDGANYLTGAALTGTYSAGPQTCKTCHNSVTDPNRAGITKIWFPQGNVVTVDPATAICGQCHTGARPGYEVQALITKIGATADDVQLPTSNSVVRAHYLPAASTLLGSEAANYFQYAGKTYSARNVHAGKGSCVDCHDPHTGKLPTDVARKCGICHFNGDAPVATLAELNSLRQMGFVDDIDGDGAIEALSVEVDGVASTAFAAMQAYATNVAGASICSIDNRYYIVADGAVACNVAPNTVQYNRFTPRLLRAGYNYLLWQNDARGAYAHNLRYIVEILVDMIEDLNAGLVANGQTAVPFNGVRAVAGAPLVFGEHFNAAAMPWTDDEGGGWSTSCLRCHTNEGFRDYVGVDASPNYLTTGTNFGKVTSTLKSTTAACEAAGTCTAGAYAYGPLQCNACHNAQAAAMTKVSFPTNIQLDTDANTALCSPCHQGRESTATVNVKIGAAAPDDKVNLGFRNPHYLGAAGTLFGGDAGMWYQYAGKYYTGTNTHGGEGSCTSCHDAHSGAVEVTAATCGRCHFDEVSGAPVANFLQLEESRQFGLEGDVDGDGVQESLKAEIDGLAATLLVQIRAYALSNIGTAILYDGSAHPYFFVDNNGDGYKDATDTTSFALFTPRLLRAAFNYKWTQAEPGAWAHNPRYTIEVLFDSIEDLNVGLGAGAIPFAGVRTFAGHFGAADAANPAGGMAFRDWDGGQVPANCSQCHAGETGLANYLANQLTATKNTPVVGMECTTCHVTGGADFKQMRPVAAVRFPPAKDPAAVPSPNQVSFDPAAMGSLTAGDLLCATCHSGRENGTTVDNAIASNYALSVTSLAVASSASTTTISVTSSGWKADRYRNARLTFTTGANAGASVIVDASTATSTTTGTADLLLASAPAAAMAVGDQFDVTFDASTFGVGATNPHYLGAAGILLGADAHMLYQYGANAYSGKPINWGAPHGSPHGASCTGCHDPQASKHSFEVNLTSCVTCHTGGYALAPKEEELAAASAQLLATLQSYTAAAGFPVCYNGASHPYWFVAVGTACPTTSEGGRQARFDAKGAKAAFNYKWSQAEPGAYAHNLEYTLEAIYDSIEDLGGTPGFTRPIAP